MSNTVIAFSLWAAIGLTFVILMLVKERNFAWARPTAFGDTTLGRNSVNWMAALALLGALVLCWMSAR
jgi:hypothetical protein